MDRYNRLVNDRSTWVPHWRDIGEHILARRMRLLYDSGKRNFGGKVNQKIINSTASQALRILSSGMMSGISSPARPWFRLTTPYPELMNVESIRGWLRAVEVLMRSVFARSNIYSILQLTYRDLAAFGIAAQCVEEDDRDVIRGYSYPIGSYVVQNDHRLSVDTIYHEKWMTVGQIAEEFGFDNASVGLKAKWENNEIDAYVRILHCIEPNETYDASQFGRAGKKYRSVWLEYDSGTEDGEPLFEAVGFNEFPAMVPRWDLTAEDTYGNSPGMDALGDIRALQQLERRKLTALDKVVNPPMTAPVELERKKRSQLAGDVTFLSNAAGGQKFEPAYQIDSRVVMIREEILIHQNRIEKVFYNDLFLMLASMDQAQPITAREVDERHEEKMLQLGPVLERLHDELLTPLIDRTFEIMLRRGMIPEPPIELQGMELRVEFISILAQAQKLLGTISVERLVSFVGNMAAVFPDVVDKINSDNVVDDYADMLGTDPDEVVTGDELAAKRQQRAQQQQMAAMAAMAKPASDAANAASNLAAADQGQPGTLDSLVGALQP